MTRQEDNAVVLMV